MRYFKRFWDETEGGELPCACYLETDDTLYPTRQINHFDSGKIFKYDSNKFHDDYGMLADQPLDLDEFKEFEITKEEFEVAWLK